MHEKGINVVVLLPCGKRERSLHGYYTLISSGWHGGLWAITAAVKGYVTTEHKRTWDDKQHSVIPHLPINLNFTHKKETLDAEGLQLWCSWSDTEPLIKDCCQQKIIKPESDQTSGTCQSSGQTGVGEQ